MALGGLEVSQRLREIDPDIQMVVTSGYSEGRVMSHFTEFGFVECLSKPYSYGDLSRIVEALVGRKAS